MKNFTNAFEIRTYTVEEYKINVAYVTGIANLELLTAEYSKLRRASPITPIITGALESYEFKIVSFNGLQPRG